MQVYVSKLHELMWAGEVRAWLIHGSVFRFREGLTLQALALIGVARGGKGTTPSELLAYPIVLCLERRCPTKQNTAVCLKSKYLPPQTYGLATLLLRFGMTQKFFVKTIGESLVR